jgi:murein DD-endopeptidase MepM/ murein hydrolase activator NlpD
MLGAMSRLAVACLVFAGAACVAPAPQAPLAKPALAVEEAPLELHLPVEGTWIVIQGYQSSGTHRGYAAYALDLVKLDERGRAHARKGLHTQDWYGFGADVLASADGVVVRAIDRFADNRVWGKGKQTNTVIVRHGSVFSEYVHLQHGSLRVREGERVLRGQPLARCGNSGAETPHLHWALLASLEPIRTRPATFARYALRDALGAWLETRGATPREGDVIRH